MAEEKNGKIVEKKGKRVRVATYNSEPTRTQQHLKDQVDVNQIMAKYRKTGTITHLRNAQNGVYLDLTTLPADYLEAMTTVTRAQEVFNEIPAEIRQRFGNSPAALIQFLSDSKNMDEAVRLGLAVRKAPPPPPPSTEPPPALAAETPKT